MTRRVLILLLAAGIAAAAAADAGAARLRRSVTVNGDVVRLGDIFDGPEGAAAALIVARAPVPGRRLVLDTLRLASIARQAGLDWKPQGRLNRIVIERASRMIEPAEIEDAVLQELLSQGLTGEREVRLVNRRLKVHVAADAAEPFRIGDARYSPRTGRFSASLVVPLDGRSSSRTRITGRVYTVVDVPVLSRQVAPGEIIGRNDIDLVSRRAEMMRRGAILAAATIVGQTPRRMLRPGVPLRRGDLRPPVLVEKGSLVTVIYRTSNMMLTAKARAANDGARGDTIRVVNVRSKKSVEGTVVAPGQVAIQGLDVAVATAGGAR